MTQFIFPKPTDWNAFEDIVCDVFARKYRNLNFQRYGRSGQRQHGVDIAGFTQTGLLGVQCKHHPNNDIRTAEIDAEVTESEEFIPALAEFVIVTSADRDTKSHNHVLQLAEKRRTGGKHLVAIKYWEDICGWLSEYPDLVYKHFTKFYPYRELDHLYLSAIESAAKRSIQWPCTQDELITHVTATMGTLQKISPYLLAIGLTTFGPAIFAGKTDLGVSLADNFTSTENPVIAFSQISDSLKQLKTSIQVPFFAKKLLIYPQTRLSYGFLFGWTFRKVTGFDLLVAARLEVWPSEGLVLTPTKLADDFPVLRDSKSEEVALILNISRDIRTSASNFIESWDRQPKAIVSYRLEGGLIESAAHALSLALEIGRKIKNLVDNWGARKIHLFGALPVALAILIGHHLNAICPIDIYFLDESREIYQLGGTITNSL